ncbi:MAG TPA: hypothetical protein VEL74_13040 [Thermoanaerobaculia bacterium]|nr:hypothetical protein [Thermoanaerobaculia bacterium]
MAPAPAAGPQSSQIAQQLLASRATSPSAPAALFESPPGFVVVPATWSALSAAPSALVLHVESRKVRQPWF